MSVVSPFSVLQVCLQMEALHPDAFKPQLPPGYESAATVFHRCAACRVLQLCVPNQR